VTKAARDLKLGKLKPLVYVNDDLSVQRRALFKAARFMKRNKEISDCWERGGKIGVKAQNGEI